jgi:hypothetical protein
MAEKPDAPATGAFIEIGGELRKVHCDCKAVRDNLEAYFRFKAMDFVDQMLKEKLISKERHEEQTQQAFREIRHGDYSYGTPTFGDIRTGTDYGIKFDLFARLVLEYPKITLEQVSDWVDAQEILMNEDHTTVTQNRWSRARMAMAIADGFVPKSDTPAAGPLSAGESSKSTAGQ